MSLNFLDEEGVRVLWDKIKQLNINTAKFYINTKEHWDSQLDLIAEQNVLYFYSNYKTINNKNVFGLKLGDGTSYLIDLPFETQILDEHIIDQTCHITNEERESWNNKVTCYVNDNNEEIIFSKE